MSTPQQAAASGANSLKSAGPRTPQGQTAFRHTALKHGIHTEHEIMLCSTNPPTISPKSPPNTANTTAPPIPSGASSSISSFTTHRALKELHHQKVGQALSSANSDPFAAESPATRTIQTHFHILSFVPSKSENRPAAVPQTPVVHQDARQLPPRQAPRKPNRAFKSLRDSAGSNGRCSDLQAISTGL
jgi:hypothetical protein